MNSQGLIAWFTRHRVAANLLMVFILVAGIFSAWSIRKEFFPEVETGAITVKLAYPGAAPDEVERGLCIKIEEALEGLDGIERMDATVYEGGGEIVIQSTRNTRVRDLIDRISSRIDGIDSFPKDVETPVIEENILRAHVMWLILASTLDEPRLKDLAETLRDEMTSRENISKVDIHGLRREEISVEVSEESMRRFGLTFDEVTEAIRNGSVSLPGGQIKSAGGDILLRGQGKATTAAQFSDILLRAGADGARVTVGDTARVRDGFAEDNFFVRFQGKPAVAFQVFRVGDESTLSVARAVKAYIKEKGADLPEGTVLLPVADTSKMLGDRLALMLKNIAMGGILVFLCLALFLQPTIAFWVMAGLPVCFLGTLFLMPLPPFGIIALSGVVVNDSLLMVDMINRNRSRGMALARAVSLSGSARFRAILLTSLTTFAGLCPMLMEKSLQAQFLIPMSVSLAFGILFATVITLFLIPCLYLIGADCGRLFQRCRVSLFGRTA